MSNDAKYHFNGIFFDVNESVHTKTGEAIWIAKPIGKLNREEYKKLEKNMNAKGGYYSRFVHGFIFQNDPSKFFISEIKEESHKQTENVRKGGNDMEFSVDRMELLEMSKKAMKLAEDNSPIELLRGIYLKCDKETGEVIMLATNYAASICITGQAVVSSSGSIVINAKMLTDMLTLLQGKTVTFTIDKKNDSRVKIFSENSMFQYVYADGKDYPKPKIPSPEECTQVSGLRTIADKTLFASSNVEANEILNSVYLRIHHNSLTASASNGNCVVLAREKLNTISELDLYLPAKSFQKFASIISDDDVFEVGKAEQEIVFTGKEIIFTMKQLTNRFININQLVQSVTPMYVARVPAQALMDGLNGIWITNENITIRISWSSGKIQISSEDEKSESFTEIAAEVEKETPNLGFCYKIKEMFKLTQVVEGTLKLEIDKNGMMLLRTNTEVFIQPSVMDTKKEQYTKKKAA